VIAYLDASALVKRYTTERGSDLVRRFLEEADIPATAILTRGEVTAAFAKAIRVGALEPGEALECRQFAGRALVEDWRAG